MASLPRKDLQEFPLEADCGQWDEDQCPDAPPPSACLRQTTVRSHARQASPSELLLTVPERSSPQSAEVQRQQRGEGLRLNFRPCVELRGQTEGDKLPWQLSQRQVYLTWLWRYQKCLFAFRTKCCLRPNRKSCRVLPNGRLAASRAA